MNIPELTPTTAPSIPPDPPGHLVIVTDHHQALVLPGLSESLIALGGGKHLLVTDPQPSPPTDHDGNDR